VPRGNSRRGARSRDPHQAREARKYANPIPSREFILEVLAEQAAPLKFDRIAERLELADAEQLEALSRRLSAMERDGQLVCNRRGGYCVVNQTNLVAGRVIGHPDGFGFLKPDDGADDLFLSPREMRALMHGDRAVVRVTGVDHRGRREGALVEVLERGNRNVVGRLYMEGGVGFVVPDNKRLAKEIVVPQFGLEGAAQGQMVVVEITDQPTSRTPPLGRVAEVLGAHMAPGMEIDVAIRAHDLPLEWPAEVHEAVAVLGGGGDHLLREATVALSREAMVLRDWDPARAESALVAALDDGTALDAWQRMVEAHGGDPDPERLAKPVATAEVTASADGFVVACDGEELGRIAASVGAGRRRMEEELAHGAGIKIHARIGDRVEKGEPLATLLVGTRQIDREQMISRIRDAFRVGAAAVNPPRLILGTVDEV
jgi:cold shock CspA family protein